MASPQKKYIWGKKKNKTRLQVFPVQIFVVGHNFVKHSN